MVINFSLVLYTFSYNFLFSDMAVATLLFNATCLTMVPVATTHGTAMEEVGGGGVEADGTVGGEIGDDGGLKT